MVEGSGSAEHLEFENGGKKHLMDEAFILPCRFSCVRNSYLS